MPRPDLANVPQWFHGYIKQTTAENVMEAIKSNTEASFAFFRSIPEEKWTHRYAEGKWDIKEMMQHIIDAERIFSYRALCFARGERQYRC